MGDALGVFFNTLFVEPNFSYLRDGGEVRVTASVAVRGPVMWQRADEVS
jgi:hypothetical protein